MRLTKTILARIWWLGRGTATMMGVAVLLALTVGLASTALAGTGIGARFDLGKVNKVDAVSSLVGNVSGPTLALENDRSDRAATALSLKMENPNLAPMRTNATGTVTNFNADGLDGRDSTSFADGINGKAKDASKADFATSAGEAQNAQVASNTDKLDGKESDQFLAANGKASDSDRLDGLNSSSFWTGERYGLLSSPKTGTPFAETFSEVGSCDPGDTAIYGGYRFLDNNGDHEIVRETLFSDSFMVSWSNGPAAETLEANVVCADFPPLR